MRESGTNWEAADATRLLGLSPVDGLSTWGSYGELVATRSLDSGGSINAVDCATDDDESVFVTWSHPNASARWARLAAGSVYGPYTVNETCEEDPSNRPRIAWNPAGRVTVMYHGYPATCSVCFETFNAYTGAEYSSDSYWAGDANTPQYWDLEWNGDEDFVAVFQTNWDGGQYSIESILVDTDGDAIVGSGDTIDGWPPLSTDVPVGIDVVYSPNSSNTYSRLITITDRETYWINQDGTGAGSWTGYAASPTAYVDGCEYWGPTSYRIAHSYTNRVDGTVGTVHRHWYRTQYAPLLVYNLNTGYRPSACSSSDTYTDREVFLVSNYPTAPNPVYWNIEAED
jgi:hypothetical protein